MPLVTSSHVRLNIHLGTGRKTGRQPTPPSTVCMVVHAHVVPDTAMSTALLLGRDSWSHFPIRKYRDVSDTETILTFFESNRDLDTTHQRYTQWIDSAQGMIEGKGTDRVIVRVASHRHRLQDTMSCLKVRLTKMDGTDAAKGSYYVRFGPERFPQEAILAILESGVSEIPLQRLNEDGFLVQTGMRLRVGGDRLQPCKLDDADIVPTELSGVHIIAGDGSPGKLDDETPAVVLSNLNPDQRTAFRSMWSKIPVHLRAIHFDFEESLWNTANIDSLGNLLNKHAHRFSKHSTDLGRVTVDPFRIILKKDAQPVKQRPYRHFPVLAAKVQTELDKLVLAGILRRSYPNWSSPLVVIAKADGRISLTCNYKRLDAQSIIPIMPLPTVDDLLSDLGGANVFSPMDLVSGFFQCSIH